MWCISKQNNSDFDDLELIAFNFVPKVTLNIKRKLQIQDMSLRMVNRVRVVTIGTCKEFL